MQRNRSPQQIASSSSAHRHRHRCWSGCRRLLWPTKRIFIDNLICACSGENETSFEWISNFIYRVIIRILYNIVEWQTTQKLISLPWLSPFGHRHDRQIAAPAKIQSCEEATVKLHIFACCTIISFGCGLSARRTFCNIILIWLIKLSCEAASDQRNGAGGMQNQFVVEYKLWKDKAGRIAFFFLLFLLLQFAMHIHGIIII